ncbi:MAG TPA: serine/threonine-protein kinase [Candidatus Polarisedimenticolaceae bacterium]|nr:serine/threonine-protein kinase [Candidatus Polarisedimenticolaceae bacterium]
MTRDIGPPSAIGTFSIVREIGRGGMGVVYEAAETETGRRVALKVVRGEQFVDEAVLRLFRREVQALARLEHAGIASLYASGRTDDGFHYFAMELAFGEALDAWLASRPDPPSREEIEKRLGLFLEIADAVAYAHQRGVLHRDLKPSNLVVTIDGHVKVLDFGLARITDVDLVRATQATELGTLRGTLAYMSPEQLAGDPDRVDARADVYALGIVLHEMLVKAHPFDLEEVPAFDVPRVLRDEPPRALRSLWKAPWRLDPDLATIVGTALEKDPDRRYGSVSALADDLRRFRAGQPVLARTPSAAYQLRKLVVRHKVPFAALALVVVLLAGFGIAMTVVARNLVAERNRANQEARAAQRGAKVLSELVRADLTFGIYSDRVLDPQAVERLVSSLETRWPDRPEATVSLLEHVGAALATASLYDPAIRCLTRAVEIRKDVLRDPDWEASARTISLGEYLVIAGRLREAEAIFASAAARARSRPDTRHDDLGYILENLGCVRRDLGKLDDAEALIREALALYGSSKPNWLPYVASAHDSLGTLYLIRGDLERAEAEQREALRLRNAYQPTDINHIRGVYMLGLVLVRRGRTAEAAPLLEEALESRTILFGDSSADVAPVQDALGEMYLADGKLERAEEALTKSLAAFDASLPPDNPARAAALVHLAELRRRQARTAEAKEAFEKALGIRERVLGDEHPDTVRTREALAGL